jgi:hypothetical protein
LWFGAAAKGEALELMTMKLVRTVVINLSCILSVGVRLGKDVDK